MSPGSAGDRTGGSADAVKGPLDTPVMRPGRFRAGARVKILGSDVTTAIDGGSADDCKGPLWQ